MGETAVLPMVGFARSSFSWRYISQTFKNQQGTGSDTHHIITRKKFLEEFCLFVHHSLDDEFIVAGDIEEGATGPRIGEFDQWLVAQGILRRQEDFNHRWETKSVGFSPRAHPI